MRSAYSVHAIRNECSELLRLIIGSFMHVRENDLRFLS